MSGGCKSLKKENKKLQLQQLIVSKSFILFIFILSSNITQIDEYSKINTKNK